MRDQAGSWMAFLAMCFAVVGLTGVFASFTIQLPLERALARDATLDEVLAANAGPDPQAAITALAPRLADSYDAVKQAGPELPQLVVRERLAMRARFERQTDQSALQIRLMIGVITVMATVFGCAILAMSRRGATDETPRRSAPEDTSRRDAPDDASRSVLPDHIRRNGEAETSNTREV